MVVPDGGEFNHIETEILLAGNTWKNLDWEKENMYWIKEKIVNNGLLELSEYTGGFCVSSF